MGTFPFTPDWVICPGMTLRDWCDENDLRHNQLAARVGISAKHLSRIMTGDACYSPALCVRLAAATGISPELLYRLQADWLIGRALGRQEFPS